MQNSPNPKGTKIRPSLLVAAVVVIIIVVGALTIPRGGNSFDPAILALCDNPSTNVTGRISGYRTLPVDDETKGLDTALYDMLRPEEQAQPPNQVDAVLCIKSGKRNLSTVTTCTREQWYSDYFLIDPKSQGTAIVQRRFGSTPPNCTSTQNSTIGTPISKAEAVRWARTVMLLRFEDSFSGRVQQQVENLVRGFAGLLPIMLLAAPGIIFVLLLLWFVAAPPEIAILWGLRNNSRFARVFYFAIAGFLFTITFGLFPIVAWIVAIIAYMRDPVEKRSQLKFSKYGPFYAYGSFVESTQMVFGRKEADLTPSQALDAAAGAVQNVIRRYAGNDAKDIDIIDVGSKLETGSKYAKHFLTVQHTTPLKSTVSVLFSANYNLSNFHIRWWTLVRGKLNFWWRGFFFIFYAPFTLLGWGLPTLLGTFSIKAWLAAVIDYTYDHFDINSWLDIFQQQVFNALLNELDKAGFDVEYYRKYPINFINNHYTSNINGSGISIGVMAVGSQNAVSANANIPAPAMMGRQDGVPLSPVKDNYPLTNEFVQQGTQGTRGHVDIDDIFQDTPKPAAGDSQPVQPPDFDDPKRPVQPADVVDPLDSTEQ